MSSSVAEGHGLHDPRDHMSATWLTRCRSSHNASLARQALNRPTGLGHISMAGANASRIRRARQGDQQGADVEHCRFCRPRVCEEDRKPHIASTSLTTSIGQGCVRSRPCSEDLRPAEA